MKKGVCKRWERARGNLEWGESKGSFEGHVNHCDFPGC